MKKKMGKKVVMSQANSASFYQPATTAQPEKPEARKILFATV